MYLLTVIFPLLTLSFVAADEAGGVAADAPDAVAVAESCFALAAVLDFRAAVVRLDALFALRCVLPVDPPDPPEPSEP
jgi:hypothetical protein